MPVDSKTLLEGDGPQRIFFERDVGWKDAKLFQSKVTSTSPGAEVIGDAVQAVDLNESEWRIVYGWLKQWFEPEDLEPPGKGGEGS